MATTGMNNQGIAHLSHRAGGHPVCNARYAIASVTLDVFEQGGWQQCKRCQKHAERWRRMREVKAEAVGA